ncbi:MAG: apolipoprotein N-acyltransferase [Myxococcota bacterium]|jgi:apolipoprotein N-acyltransferase
MPLETKRTPKLATVASALLLALAFPPLELHVLVWFALVPWLHVVRSCATWYDAAVQGFWFNVVYGLATTFWIGIAVPQYLDVSFFVGAVAVVAHALVSQLQFVVFAPVFHRLTRNDGGVLNPLRVVLAAGFYVGLDWIVPNVYQDTIGLPLHAYAGLRQVVELGGLHLLGVLVLFANLAVFGLVSLALHSTGSDTKQRSKAGYSAAMVCICIAAAWGWGTARHEALTHEMEGAPRTIRAGLVQGAISIEQKQQWMQGDSAAAHQALDVYVEQTTALLKSANPPQLIVWPETAYPGIFRRPENEEQLRINVAFDRYLAAANVPFVFGAYDREERTDKRVLRNAIYMVEPSSDTQRNLSPPQPSPMQVYHKYILFPIGEYIPGLDDETARSVLPRGGSFSTGSGPKVFRMSLAGTPTTIGTAICYEDVFPSHFNALALQGAELLVNVSDDSWFGDFGEPRLHFIFAKLASVRTRLPQLRATNTGYSAAILPNGDVLELSTYGESAGLVVDVPILGPQQTYAARYGEWGGALALMFATLGILAVEVRS